MSIKGLLKDRLEGEREREKAGRGWKIKTWQGKSLPVSPPHPWGEAYCLQNKQCNEKDKGGLRRGRRHEMTYKNTQSHTPPPSWHLSLTFSAPSCESPPLYLQPGLRRAVHGNCSSSGACHTACSYPSHEETASPRSSHIWIRRQRVPSRWVQYHPKWPSQAVCFERVCVYMPGVKLFYFKSKDVIFFISCICKLSSGPAVDNWGYEWIL